MPTKKAPKIESIDNLWVYPFPVRPLAASVRMVRVEHGSRRSVAVAVTEGGKVYSSEASGIMPFPQFADSLDATWRGCIKLRVLSADVLKKARAEAKEKAEKRGRAYNAEMFAKNARELGLQLTKAQTAKAIEAMGGGKTAASRARLAEAGIKL